MKCGRCGNIVPEDTIFCPKCGKRLKVKVKRNGLKYILCALIIFLIGTIFTTIYIYVGNDSINNFISNTFKSEKKYDDEIKNLIPLFVSKVNADNILEYNRGARDATDYKVNNTKYKLVTLTESLIEAEFKEEYKGIHIFYVTSKGPDKIEILKYKSVNTRDKIITVESEKCDGVYVCKFDNDEVKYSAKLETLKMFIDRKY